MTDRLVSTDPIARAIDPEAFEHHPIEERSTTAALQWTARRLVAQKHANRVRAFLTSDAMRERVAESLWDESRRSNLTPLAAMEAQHYAANALAAITATGAQ